MNARVSIRVIVALGFVVAGVNHFLAPEVYLAMMPPFLPAPDLLHKIAGGAEILGGLGLLVPPTRRLAMIGLVALLVAIFPANLYVAWIGKMGDLAIPAWVLWARLPFQALFIAVVIWVGRDGPKKT
ncbi:MAG TPA: DoxX family protein [Opitutaceae bacterium]|nr:DoxX family protein [Opitutaceae bacterium]